MINQNICRHFLAKNTSNLPLRSSFFRRALLWRQNGSFPFFLSLGKKNEHLWLSPNSIKFKGLTLEAITPADKVEMKKNALPFFISRVPRQFVCLKKIQLANCLVWHPRHETNDDEWLGHFFLTLFSLVYYGHPEQLWQDCLQVWHPYVSQSGQTVSDFTVIWLFVS